MLLLSGYKNILVLFRYRNPNEFFSFSFASIFLLILFDYLSSMNIFNLPRTEEEAVAFLQEKGILPTERTCPNNHKMKLYFGQKVSWKCNLRSCRKMINMRVGNWLKDTCLPLLERTSLRLCWRQLWLSGLRNLRCNHCLLLV